MHRLAFAPAQSLTVRISSLAPISSQSEFKTKTNIQHKMYKNDMTGRITASRNVRADTSCFSFRSSGHHRAIYDPLHPLSASLVIRPAFCVMSFFVSLSSKVLCTGEFRPWECNVSRPHRTEHVARMRMPCSSWQSSRLGCRVSITLRTALRVHGLGY
ncbi:hypothetical protein F5148DRAFT_6371 [Russula earlei]|uniref:Uncharacterized protein n=1 Tax=Russula earlei TaxID=71964 RepID=A0ACC0UPM7_9AGAM|nr:hypothetical protein F5148DRAFT_6371 [Russula earlei]